MNIRLSLIVFLGSFFLISAQTNSSITLEDIWGGKFVPKRVLGFHSMKDGNHYVKLSQDPKTKSSRIDKYSYATLQKVGSILSSNDIEELSYFGAYIFSPDENKILLRTHMQPIYRHSKKGKYYIYDLKTKAITLLSEHMVQEPSFSPDGNQVAFVYNNNLYVKNINNGTLTTITADGRQNAIINGVTDWVYEEEFAFVQAYQWNATGTQIAFLRFDETEVPEFSMDTYGKELYPISYTFKYPKAGEANSKITLHLYDLAQGQITTVPLETYYIPRIQWTKSPNVLSIQTLNRHQNDLRLLTYDIQTKKISILLKEHDKAYIDITDNLIFLKDGSFLWTNEQNGYNHVYHYAKTGKLIRQITKGSWEVTSVYGYNTQDKTIYYQSTERGSTHRDLYRIRLNGHKKQRLSPETKGMSSAEFSADMSYFVRSYSNPQQPPQYTLHQANGNKLKDIIVNEDYAKKIANYKLSKKEFSTIKINGNQLNMWMIKPSNFDSSKQYPLFMAQYSGPGSQQVSEGWLSTNDFWYMMLAQHGYIIACVDGRGTGYKGAAFKKITYKELGKYEVEDQIAVANALGERDYIDASRIGIWGWSFGGFMSSNCILKGNHTFKMAIAVAPVTSWRFYDTIYTERYMQTPQENPTGYDDNSPLNYANKLKGHFLLIHGSADDNVHFQNSMRMIEALVQANKPFDWAVYPDKNHGIYGGNTRLHLYTKMTNYIKNNL